jgi:fructose-1,6-bisphosphatase I
MLGSVTTTTVELAHTLCAASAVRTGGSRRVTDEIDPGGQMMPRVDPDPPAPPVTGRAPEELVTIERFLSERQPEHASGTLTGLLYDLALAGKLIASKTRRAGLTDLLGRSGVTNVQGEEQQNLDVYADQVVAGLLSRGGRVCALVSEERAEVTIVPGGGPYVVVYDPLDGSSNIDANVSIGTIFGVFRRTSVGGDPGPEDWLRPGRDLVAAGYVLYGTSTMLVYSSGEGVHAFTLDPEVGEFLLTWSDLTFADDPSYYSFNLATSAQWERGVRRFIEWIERDDTPTASQRYIGSAVADVHRNLLHGGIFGYPGTVEQPEGKLRLLYEAAPLAYLAEQAAGAGSNGQESLLDLIPEAIHQRTPVFVGAAELVGRLEEFVAGALDG